MLDGLIDKEKGSKFFQKQDIISKIIGMQIITERMFIESKC